MEPHDGITILIKRDTEILLSLSVSPPEEGCLQARNRGLPRTNHVGTLISDFQPPEL